VKNEMKRPEKIWFQPLDAKKDEEGGMWFRLPAWLVRAYRIKFPPNMFKLMFLVSDKKICFNKGTKKFSRNLVSKYYKENWSKKLTRENRKKRESSRRGKA